MSHESVTQPLVIYTFSTTVPMYLVHSYMLCVHIVTYYWRALESYSDTQSRLVDALRNVCTSGSSLTHKSGRSVV